MTTLEIRALTSAQQLFEFIEVERPGTGYGPLVTMTAARRVAGPLDIVALRRGLDVLVARHDILRTAVVPVDGRRVQQVHPPSPAPVQVDDRSAVAAEDRDAAAEAILREAVLTPVDVAHPPLLRAGVTRLGPDDHVFTLTVHHSVADLWTLEILLAELAELYRAGEGRGGSGPSRSVNDHAPDVERAAEFWRRRLAGVDPPAFPASGGATPPSDGMPGCVQVSIPHERIIGLRTLATSEQVPISVALLAAFKTVVHLCSGSVDVVVPTLVSGRTTPESERVVGFFLDALVMRTDFDGGPTFRDALRRVRATVLDAYDHRDLPIAGLLDHVPELVPLLVGGASWVLFQVVETPTRRTLTAGPTRWTPLVTDRPIPSLGSALPLDFEFTVVLDGVDASAMLLYDAGKFARPTIEHIGRVFLSVLDRGVAEPDVVLSSLAVDP